MPGIFGDRKRYGIFGSPVADPRAGDSLQAPLDELGRPYLERNSLLARIAAAPSKLFGGLVVDPIVDAMTMAGDVNSGAQPTMAFDPQTGETGTSPQLAGRTLNAATILAGGAGMVPAETNSLRMGIKAEPEALASRRVSVYDPPRKSPRLFEEDYKGGASVDEAGNLTHDIEGNPLTARFIAGRRRAGEPDVGLSPADIQAVAEEGFGARMEVVPGSFIRGDAGRLTLERVPETGREDWRIYLNSKLTPTQAERVTAHEVSHLIDTLAKEIPTTGILQQLRQVYNTMNTGRERTRHLTGPEQARPSYRGADIQRELMADAIRAYMRDPNYLKKVAPETAEAIRTAVNKNPELAQVIQFNVGGIPLPLPQGEPQEPQEAQAAQQKGKR